MKANFERSPNKVARWYAGLLSDLQRFATTCFGTTLPVYALKTVNARPVVVCRRPPLISRRDTEWCFGRIP
jgi:hypothetical protein